jgi:hypothetical protein
MEPVFDSSADRRRRRQPIPQYWLAIGSGAVAIILVGVLLIARSSPWAESPADAVDLASLSAVSVAETAGGPQAPNAPAGMILYQDTFEEPLAGLLPKTSATPDQYERGYIEGQYLIKILGGRTIATAPIPGVHSNTALSVDARRLGDNRAGSILLGCRGQDDSLRSQYRFSVDTERRQFRLYRLDDGTAVPLTEWTSSPILKGTTAQVRLELVCRGTTIAAAIDGTQVATIHDATYTTGRLYLGITTNRTGEARFDNLRVVQEPPS